MSAASTPTLTPTPATPAPVVAKNWQTELVEKFGAHISPAFILAGNIGDFVAGVGGEGLRDYLITSWQSKFTILVVYSRSTGFYFPVPQMKQKFMEVIGLVSAVAPLARPGAGGGLAAAIGVAGRAGGGSTNEEAALEALGRQPGAALAALTKALAYKPSKEEGTYRVAVILEHAHTLAPAGSDGSQASESDRTGYVTLYDWGKDTIAGAEGQLHQLRHVVVATTFNQSYLAEPLRREGWETIEIPLPDYDERLAFIEGLLNPPVDQGAGEGEGAGTVASDISLALAEGVTAPEMARLTTGLTYRGLEDIFNRANYHRQPVTLDFIKQRKDELVAAEFNEVLQIVDAQHGFADLGGMETLKTFLVENVVGPMKRGQFEVVPQGILLMGPAGTGKSRITKALAGEANVTFVELQPSKIFSKWVGDSERNLDRALAAIKSMTPCIVFIDEIDQSVSRGEGAGGDSGVSSRFFKRLMEFMADTTLRGKVLFVAATNRPDLMDAALRRPGRLDLKIPVLAPNAEEREAILAVLTRQAFPSLDWTRAGSLEPELVECFRELSQDTEDYTGAELELITTKAARLYHKAGGAGAGVLTVAQALRQAHELILPTTQDIVWMTELALVECSDLELVPEVYRPRVRQLRRNQGRRQSQQQESELVEAATPTPVESGAGRLRRGGNSRGGADKPALDI